MPKVWNILEVLFFVVFVKPRARSRNARMPKMSAIAAGIKIGIATTGAMFAAGELDKGSISIPVAAGCCVFIASCVWWLGRKFQSIEDTLEGQNKSLADLKGRMAALPCDDCNPKGKKP